MARKKITKEQMEQDINDPCLVLNYIDNLAPWLLSQSTRKRLIEETSCPIPPPQMPTGKGDVVVLFKRGDDFFPDLIAEGFALPFCWQEGGASLQKYLPKALAKEAERVKAGLEKEFSKQNIVLQDWHLSLHRSLQHLDLSELPFEAPSAALPLAASLLLAYRGGRPSTKVLSTGAIDDQGYLKSVDGYEQKLSAAAALFPSPNQTERIFFLPPTDFDKAQEAATRLNITLKKITTDNKEIWSQLNQILLELDQPPNENAELKEHIDYANRPHIAADNKGRSAYYKDHIFEKLGETLQKDELSHKQRLILPVSLHLENTKLSLIALQPKEVRFVMSKTSKNEHEGELSQFAKERGIVPSFELLPIEDRELQQEDIEKLTKWLQEAPEDERIVDFTPGNREMLAAVLFAALQSQAKVVYVRHEFLPHTRGVKYGTERFILLPSPFPSKEPIASGQAHEKES